MPLTRFIGITDRTQLEAEQQVARNLLHPVNRCCAAAPDWFKIIVVRILRRPVASPPAQ